MPQSGSGGTASGSVPLPSKPTLPVVDGRSTAERKAAELASWRQKKAEEQQRQREKNEAEERAKQKEARAKIDKREQKKARLQQDREDKRKAEEERAKREALEQKKARTEQIEKAKREAAKRQAEKEQLEKAKEEKAKKEIKAKARKLERERQQAQRQEELRIAAGEQARAREPERAQKGKQIQKPKAVRQKSPIGTDEKDFDTLRRDLQQLLVSLQINQTTETKYLQPKLKEIQEFWKRPSLVSDDEGDEILHEYGIRIGIFQVYVTLFADPGQHHKVLTANFLETSNANPTYFKTTKDTSLVWAGPGKYLERTFEAMLTCLRERKSLMKVAERTDAYGGYEWRLSFGPKRILFYVDKREASNDWTLSVVKQFQQPDSKYVKLLRNFCCNNPNTQWWKVSFGVVGVVGMMKHDPDLAVVINNDSTPEWKLTENDVPVRRGS